MKILNKVNYKLKRSVVATLGKQLLVVFGVLLAGCAGLPKSYTQPISRGDILPNGTVGEIRSNPKRDARAQEIQAIQRAVRTNPLLSGNQVLTNVRVEAVTKPVVGFCAQLQEQGGRHSVVSGVLRKTENKLLAYDLRLGEQAQLRCNYMEFWRNSM